MSGELPVAFIPQARVWLLTWAASGRECPGEG